MALFDALQPELAQLSNIKPQIHQSISSLQQFVETFLVHFADGANGEYVSQSRDLFFLLADRLEDSKIPHIKELGGHSSVWALTAQKNQCKVFAAPQPNDFIREQHRYPFAPADNLLVMAD